MERTRQIDTSLSVMAGDTVFRSRRFCADETIIFQERRHTQAADVTAMPEIESSQRRISSRLLKRDEGSLRSGSERQPAGPL